MPERFLGIDLGAETIKVAEILKDGEHLRPGETWCREHGKDPVRTLSTLLAELRWAETDGAAATGRMARIVRLEHVPSRAAIAKGLRILHPELAAATVVSIGSHGFSVTDIHEPGDEPSVVRVRENSRCSQGTGNFLRQLVERLDLDLAAADQLCDQAEAAPLSGRCPVILKTDLTHLANKGVDRGSILAGLYDAVCENVQALIRPKEAGPCLLLIGGVSRSERIRRNFRKTAAALGLAFCEGEPGRDRFLEAFGAASIAAARGHKAYPLEALFERQEEAQFEELEAFRSALSHVHRMEPRRVAPLRDEHDVILGFDIGSTGAKAVAMDIETLESHWEHYTSTLGNPVAAAQELARVFLTFLEASKGKLRVRGAGVTGSGREIVGSMLSTCFDQELVFVLNEIAAHAEGALFHDPHVDTIFEIGGQDAKYVRLDGGRICDAAMNEACSAGTGSFIEEQGSKFEGVDSVVQMGEMAIESDRAVSLGQHCSVFMAEVIDQAVAAGRPGEQILAGIYDSVVQNYLNRVKGSRSIGDRIFCQGMPFMSDALAAAVARRTGREVIIPPNPGTIGAHGIALLALRELGNSLDSLDDELDLRCFLDARLDAKEQFTCGSTKGCGGAGAGNASNACKIDLLRVTVAGEKKKYLWGGSCSLYDRGTRKRKLPDRAPNPFRERESLIEDIVAAFGGNTGQPRIAITDEFSLKGLFPFFATFLHELGFELQVLRGGSSRELKQGIQQANVSYCAPMQLFHGLAARMIQGAPDYVFLPMVIEMPRSGTERHAATCPIVQASPGLIEQALLQQSEGPKLLAPRIQMCSANFDSASFQRCCEDLASHLGARRSWSSAYRLAAKAQLHFQQRCFEIGAQALAFAREHTLPAVVVLGRAYTIYNDVLNSNVPNLLREQGALAIPVDCYPIESAVPSFDGMYWHYGQTNLRAAHKIRGSEGVYSVYCSNYACGPDSFNLHFYSYIMQNKPFALIETDGHSGDAGTRTRIEAFLYCVASDLRTAKEERRARVANDFRRLETERQDLAETLKRGDCLLMPPMGIGTEVCAAALRSQGFRIEVLEQLDEPAFTLGRQHTSGKECLPMILTAGALLHRLEKERNSDQKFAFLMPTTCGPCRFGSYILLYKIILERNGWKDRVRIVSATDSNYFEGLSGDLTLRLWIGMVAMDLLVGALLDVRPVEKRKGAAKELFDRYLAELLALLAKPSSAGLMHGLHQARHDMFGVRRLIQHAARDFAGLKNFAKELPTVGIVGEIYLRLEPFANDFLIERLEAAGVRTRLAPLCEWVEFTTWWREKRIFEGRAGKGEGWLETWFCSAIQGQVSDGLYVEMQRPLGWGRRMPIHESVACGEHYVDRTLESETILTLGTALYDFLEGEIDGVVSVGPLECMPNKIAESHFQRAEPDFGLPSLTLSLNGDPLDASVLEDFVYQVKERVRLNSRGGRKAMPRASRTLKELAWQSSGRTVTKLLGMLPRRLTRTNGT